MRRPCNRRQLFALIQTAHFVHLSPPCSSFSIARGRDAPRSAKHPLGKPGLSAADQARVDDGNVFFKIACRIVRTCVSRGVGVCLENPRTSRMFLAPPLNRMGGEKYHTVFCAYGTPWRKATTFLTWHCPALSTLVATCSSKHGLCDHSGKPHRVLKGNSPGGMPWTRVAEPFPRALCSKYAHAVRNQHMLLFQKSLDTLCCAKPRDPPVEFNTPAE